MTRLMVWLAVLACVVVLVHGCRKSRDGKLVKQKPQSPEPFFRIKTGDDLHEIEKRLGSPRIDPHTSFPVLSYALAPAGEASFQSFGSGVSDIHVAWTSDVESTCPDQDQYWIVEYEGAPFVPTVRLSEREKSRRHAPTPFIRLVGLSRDEVATKMGAEPVDLLGAEVRFRLAPRGFADVQFGVDDRVEAVSLIWRSTEGDDGSSLQWPDSLTDSQDTDAMDSSPKATE